MAVQEFISPTSLSEAQQAVGEGVVSSWLAGGTDLLVGIRLGARDPARVIDLKQIPELTAIEIDDASETSPTPHSMTEDCRSQGGSESGCVICSKIVVKRSCSPESNVLCKALCAD